MRVTDLQQEGDGKQEGRGEYLPLPLVGRLAQLLGVGLLLVVVAPAAGEARGHHRRCRFVHLLVERVRISARARV